MTFFIIELLQKYYCMGSAGGLSIFLFDSQVPWILLKKVKITLVVGDRKCKEGSWLNCLVAVHKYYNQWKSLEELFSS